MITLTSFFDREAQGERWSGARWAPKQCHQQPVAHWARPTYPGGQAIKLRHFAGEGVSNDEVLAAYTQYLLSVYRERWPEIREWLASVQERDIVLQCWCPHTRIAKAQLHKFGSFHCHLGVVAHVLESAGVEWQYGHDHEERMVR